MCGVGLLRKNHDFFLTFSGFDGELFKRVIFPIGRQTGKQAAQCPYSKSTEGQIAPYDPSCAASEICYHASNSPMKIILKSRIAAHFRQPAGNQRYSFHNNLRSLGLDEGVFSGLRLPLNLAKGANRYKDTAETDKEEGYVWGIFRTKETLEITIRF